MKSKKIFTTILAALLGCAMIAGDSTALASGGPGGGGGGGAVGGGGAGGGGGGGGGGGNGGGGKVPVGATLQDIFNMLRGAPWESLIDSTILTATLNNNGTFTATIQSTTSGTITTDSGTWTLTPPVAPDTFVGNPQAHLAIVDKNGVVLIEGDFFVLTADQFVFFSASTVFVPGVTLGEVVLTKLTI